RADRQPGASDQPGGAAGARSRYLQRDAQHPRGHPVARDEAMRRPLHRTGLTRSAHPDPAPALLRGALAALGLLLPAAAVTEARAQTVSPPVVEYRERARGSFQLLNGSLFPL